MTGRHTLKKYNSASVDVFLIVEHGIAKFGMFYLFLRFAQKISGFSNNVQTNHLRKVWVHTALHTHALMRNREKFQADW